MKRRAVNKRRSSRKFRKQASHTKALNLRPTPMRGGFRI